MRRWLRQFMVVCFIVIFIVQLERVLAVSAQQAQGAKALFYTEAGTTVSSQSPISESLSGTPSPSKRPAKSRVATPPPVPVRQDMAATPQQDPWFGIAYWVELQRDNVMMRIADPASFNFRSGDRIRFQVMANTPGYLYIVNRGSSGQETLLFPTTQYNFNWLEARKPYPVPQSGWILFDDQPGEENVSLMLSPKPLLDGGVGEPAPSSTMPPAASARFAEVTNMCGTKDLLVCGAKDLLVERDETQGQQATYVGGVVRTSAEAPERFSLIAHRVRLLHR